MAVYATVQKPHKETSSFLRFVVSTALGTESLSSSISNYISVLTIIRDVQNCKSTQSPITIIFNGQEGSGRSSYCDRSLLFAYIEEMG